MEASCSVGMKNSYILHLDLKDESALAVALSNHSVVLYDRETLTKKVSFSAHSKTISGTFGAMMKPSGTDWSYTFFDRHGLQSCEPAFALHRFSRPIHQTMGPKKRPSKACEMLARWFFKFIHGFIWKWCNFKVSTFTEESAQAKRSGKALTSFDINASDQFLAAGTEQAFAKYFPSNLVWRSKSIWIKNLCLGDERLISSILGHKKSKTARRVLEYFWRWCYVNQVSSDQSWSVGMNDFQQIFNWQVFLKWDVN